MLNREWLFHEWGRVSMIEKMGNVKVYMNLYGYNIRLVDLYSELLKNHPNFVK